jgi:hypothetical protein
VRIGEQVGQKDLAVTANIYSHVMLDEGEVDYAGSCFERSDDDRSGRRSRLSRPLPLRRLQQLLREIRLMTGHLIERLAHATEFGRDLRSALITLHGTRLAHRVSQEKVAKTAFGLLVRLGGV